MEKKNLSFLLTKSVCMSALNTSKPLKGEVVLEQDEVFNHWLIHEAG